MQGAEFEDFVEKGYEQLPQWVREKIKNVALLIEDEPSKEDREAEGLEDDETLLGLYKGIPLSERGENYGVGMTLPDTITLYQLPIEAAALEECSTGEGDQKRYREVVGKVIAETIWHEFAHHFGMDEHEVRGRKSAVVRDIKPGMVGLGHARRRKNGTDSGDNRKCRPFGCPVDGTAEV